MKLSVNLAAVAYFQNGYYFYGVINVIQNPVVSDSHAPARPVFEFTAPRRAWIPCQVCDFQLDGFVRIFVKRCELPLGARQDPDDVAHLRFRSILATASSNGTGVSPEALASSYARMSSNSSSSSRSFWYSSMLMTTAIFSPFSLVRNCVGSFICLPLPKFSVGRLSEQERRLQGASNSQTGSRRPKAILHRRRKLSTPQGTLPAECPPGRRASCGACLLSVFRAACACA